MAEFCLARVSGCFVYLDISSQEKASHLFRFCRLADGDLRMLRKASESSHHLPTPCLLIPLLSPYISSDSWILLLVISPPPPPPPSCSLQPVHWIEAWGDEQEMDGQSNVRCMAFSILCRWWDL